MHVLFIDIEDITTYFHTLRTLSFRVEFNSFAISVTLCTTRITENHCVTVFLRTLNIDREEILRRIWLILLTEFRRFIGSISINTEDADITGMAWPHPVISFSTELTDIFRRRTYQTNILKHLIVHRQVFISSPERNDLHHVEIFLITHTFFQLSSSSFHRRTDRFSTSSLISDIIDRIYQDHRRYIFNFRK